MEEVRRRIGGEEGVCGVNEVRLEELWIPALTLRCAQHILKWGIQEEGLFRYVSCASCVNLC